MYFIKKKIVCVLHAAYAIDSSNVDKILISFQRIRCIYESAIISTEKSYHKC